MNIGNKFAGWLIGQRIRNVKKEEAWVERDADSVKINRAFFVKKTGEILEVK